MKNWFSETTRTFPEPRPFLYWSILNPVMNPPYYPLPNLPETLVWSPPFSSAYGDESWSSLQIYLDKEL